MKCKGCHMVEYEVME